MTTFCTLTWLCDACDACFARTKDGINCRLCAEQHPSDARLQSLTRSATHKLRAEASTEELEICVRNKEANAVALLAFKALLRQKNILYKACASCYCEPNCSLQQGKQQLQQVSPFWLFWSTNRWVSLVYLVVSSSTRAINFP